MNTNNPIVSQQKFPVIWEWLAVRKELIDRVQFQGNFARPAAQRVVWLAEFSALRRQSDEVEWYLALRRIAHDSCLLIELTSLAVEGKGNATF